MSWHYELNLEYRELYYYNLMMDYGDKKHSEGVKYPLERLFAKHIPNYYNSSLKEDTIYLAQLEASNNGKLPEELQVVINQMILEML